MVVDETPWERCCPRCGNTNKNVQVPITRGAPCEWCGKVPFKGPGVGLEQILYYVCLQCKQRYLIPKREGADLFESSLFSDPR